jgi:hypothetical protein
VTIGMSDREVGREILVAPAANARGFVGTDVEGAPAGGQRTCEFLPVVERERQIAWRMALAAMGQRFREIGASVPFRTPVGIGREAGVRIEQRRPEGHGPTLVIGECQRISGAFASTGGRLNR